MSSGWLPMLGYFCTGKAKINFTVSSSLCNCPVFLMLHSVFIVLEGTENTNGQILLSDIDIVCATAKEINGSHVHAFESRIGPILCVSIILL